MQEWGGVQQIGERPAYRRKLASAPGVGAADAVVALALLRREVRAAGRVERLQVCLEDSSGRRAPAAFSLQQPARASMAAGRLGGCASAAARQSRAERCAPFCSNSGATQQNARCWDLLTA